MSRVNDGLMGDWGSRLFNLMCIGDLAYSGTNFTLFDLLGHCIEGLGQDFVYISCNMETLKPVRLTLI
jgi:hypothetical protein